MPPKKTNSLPQENESTDQYVKYQRSPDFRTIYANFIQTAHTAFDVSFTFGETSGVVEEDGKALVEQKVRLVLTPLEALVLRQMLNNLIAMHQQQFGQIAVPEK